MGVKIREKPKGSGEWYVFIEHQGKRKAKRIGRDKKMAQQIAKQIEAKLTLKDTGLLQEAKVFPTFKALAEEWLAVYVKTSKRSTTYVRYSGLLRMYLNPQIGDIPINEFRRVHVLQALRHIQSKGLSRSSIDQGKNVISGVVEYALDNEYLEVNPTNGTMKRLGLSRKSDRQPITIFIYEEVDAILETCLKYEPKFYPLILAAFRTGMRLGELLALRWANVNWLQKYVQVESSWRNSKLTGTKTNKSRRVDLSDQLTAELKRLLTQRKEEALKIGKNEVVPIIFHTDNTYTSQNSVRNVWKRILIKAGLNHRKFHTCRHTFASFMLSSMVPIAYTSKMMGHNSIQMTVDIYGHLLPDQNNSAVNTLDSATNRNPAATIETKKAVTN